MQSVVVLTGAGISAESGLGTFRDVGGLWSQYDLQEVATPEGFARNPALVHDFYNARRANAATAAPNAAHEALVTLGEALGTRLTLVTQNIDDLHERAGSRDVIHMHGQLMQGLCAACGHRWPHRGDLTVEDPCPACDARAVRPDVVWFGEVPVFMDRIIAAIEMADLFVAIGNSGEVYPAAGFADLARDVGAETVEINLEPTRVPGRFDRVMAGPATQTVPAWVSEMMSRRA